MSSATTKDGLSDDTLHNTVPSFTLLKIKYKIMIKTVKFGWSQSLTGLRTTQKLKLIFGNSYYRLYNIIQLFGPKFQSILVGEPKLTYM